MGCCMSKKYMAVDNATPTAHAFVGIATAEVPVFASAESWDEVGHLRQGEKVTVCGQKVDVQGCTMVPINEPLVGAVEERYIAQVTMPDGPASDADPGAKPAPLDLYDADEPGYGHETEMVAVGVVCPHVLQRGHATPPRVCRMPGCDRPPASGTTRSGNPYDTCCRGCATGDGGHCPGCVPAAPALCREGCGRAAAPGMTPRGNPYDTCCRGCATGDDHSAWCRQADE